MSELKNKLKEPRFIAVSIYILAIFIMVIGVTYPQVYWPYIAGGIVGTIITLTRYFTGNIKPRAIGPEDLAKQKKNMIIIGLVYILCWYFMHYAYYKDEVVPYIIWPIMGIFLLVLVRLTSKWAYGKELGK